LFAAFLLFLGCKQKPNTSKLKKHIYSLDKPNTTITGKITNAAGKFVVLSQNTFIDTAYLDNHNKFVFNLNLPLAGYFQLNDGKNRFKIFLSPNYNLLASYNSNNVFGSIKFSGKGSDANIYMKEKYLLMLENDIPLTHLYQMPVKEFRHFVDSLFVIEKMFYNEFVGKKDFAEVFKQTELALLKYDRATKLMEYLNTNTETYKINTTKYLKFLNKLSVNESSLLDVYEYKLFLNAYISYYARQKTNTKNLFPFEITLAKMQTVTQKIQNQEVKDYLLFTLLNDHVRYYGYKKTEVLFENFGNECKNEELRQQLLTPHNEYVQLTQKQKAPAIEMTDVAGNKYTLSSFAGSYIYIDIWATWCLPCRKESPYFEKLKERYKHKNVVFVSLSVDKKKDDWIEYLTLKGLSGNQFLASDIKPFLDTYMIKTIPHFIIIDNKGNLTDINASRPSEIGTEWFEGLPDKASL